MNDDQMDALMDHVNGSAGIFVEAGAHDGITLSNTLRLEQERGWTGLLVEPVPTLARAARRNRPDAIVEEVALVSDEYAAKTVGLTYGGIQTVVRGARATHEEEIAHAMAPSLEQAASDPYDIEAPARTLRSLLDAHDIDSIDFLSLDVEGFEAAALDGLDLRRHRPRLILVEVWAWTSAAVSKRLVERYEQVAVFDVITRAEALCNRIPGVLGGSKWDALYRLKAAS